VLPSRQARGVVPAGRGPGRRWRPRRRRMSPIGLGVVVFRVADDANGDQRADDARNRNSTCTLSALGAATMASQRPQPVQHRDDQDRRKERDRRLTASGSSGSWRHPARTHFASSVANAVYGRPWCRALAAWARDRSDVHRAAVTDGPGFDDLSSHRSLRVDARRGTMISASSGSDRRASRDPFTYRTSRSSRAAVLNARWTGRGQ